MVCQVKVAGQVAEVIQEREELIQKAPKVISIDVCDSFYLFFETNFKID